MALEVAAQVGLPDVDVVVAGDHRDGLRSQGQQVERGAGPLELTRQGKVRGSPVATM